MAKVRVYELARELNMDSKELVEKLVGSGMSIKNYMSTLDEAATIKAKEIVSGVISEVIEERRIKPTIIRRRKKIKRVETEIPAETLEEEVRKEKAEELVPEPPKEEGELHEMPVVGAMGPKEVLEGKVVEGTAAGEGIPQEAYSKSLLEAEVADVFLVIGTTGEIMPACLVPQIAKRNGAKIIHGLSGL